MELRELIDLLSRAEAYPHPLTGPVDVCQTHISVVFLAGPYAYKIKKPLDLGFLDFTSLAKRRHFCLEEVRLNRRLAPNVYLGAVPVALRDGTLQVDGQGTPVEWAVWMRRLPDHLTLANRLARGAVDAELIRRIGCRLADFYAGAEGGPGISAFGRWDVVARNARENLAQTRPHVGTTMTPEVYDRISGRLEAKLSNLRGLVEGRASRGLPRDTHGDLHLDHVYLFDSTPPPDDLAIVDCIEFNERFRYADPVSDIAFLAMDLMFSGRKDLATALVDAYLLAAGDEEGRGLVPFYISYRAAVRAKVEGFKALEPEVPEAERQEAVQRARAHWLLALGALEAPDQRPCLLLIGGLPGTGKSSLARELGREAGFALVSSDPVRKELAGLAPTESGGAGFGQGIYTPQWNDRVYDECRRRAERLLGQGLRVAVDANFRDEPRRREFIDAGRRWGVPVLLLLREADRADVRQRLAARQGDASDADWSVYERAEALWEEPGPDTRDLVRRVPAYPTKREATAAVLEVLRFEGLC